jgi:hypothetical protein
MGERDAQSAELNRHDAEHAKKKLILCSSSGVLGVLAVQLGDADRAP